MRYFLDFDRTIFDTPAFKRSVAKRPTLGELGKQSRLALGELLDPGEGSSRRRALAKTLGTFLSHGRLAFSPDELAGFLYPDTAGFLARHDCTVVTYGVEAFIKAKVISALTNVRVTDIVYTHRKKGRTLKRLTEEGDGPFAFVDDAAFQLESVAAWCPGIALYEMRRDGLPGDGRWPVVRSLEELPQD